MSHKHKPLFSCVGCSDIQTFPADDLRQHGDDPWCGDCWDGFDMDTETGIEYTSQPEFIPEADQKIKELTEALQIIATHDLQFKPSTQKPHYEPEPDAEYLLLNPCDGFHIAYGNFDHDTQEFERFSNFTGGQTYGPDQYIAWAKLPDAVKIIDSAQEAAA